MKVKAKAEGSLVISQSAPTASTTTVTHTFSEDQVELYASTHDATSTTGLKYVTNGDVISPDTGLPYTEADTLSYSDAINVEAVEAQGTKGEAGYVPAVEEKLFYKDFSIFISSSGDELEDQKIKVELTNTSVNTLNGAISIDFYCDEEASSTVVVPAASSNYVNTLNLAQLDASENDASTGLTSFYIGETSGLTITKNSAGTGISILMRVYFDGALLDYKDETNQYLLTESAEASTSEQNLYNNRAGKVTIPANGDVTGLFAKENVTRDTNGAITAYACDTTFAKNRDVEEIGSGAELGVKFTSETIA